MGLFFGLDISVYGSFQILVSLCTFNKWLWLKASAKLPSIDTHGKCNNVAVHWQPIAF